MQDFPFRLYSVVFLPLGWLYVKGARFLFCYIKVKSTVGSLYSLFHFKSVMQMS